MPEFRTEDGVRIQYHDHGSGVPVVFVHGWMMSGRFFQPQLQELSDEFRVIAPDLRGCGDSESRPGSHVVPRYAADLHELLAHVGEANAHLVGWSMGGGIAMECLQRYGSAQVRSIGLIDFPPRIAIDEPEAARVCSSLVKRRPEFTRNFLQRMFVRQLLPPEISWMLAESAKSPAEAACEMYRSMRPANLPAKAGPFHAPAFLAFPAQGWFAASLPEWRAMFPKHEAPSFAASRHCPFLEEADHFNDELRGFLHRCPP